MKILIQWQFSAISLRAFEYLLVSQRVPSWRLEANIIATTVHFVMFLESPRGSGLGIGLALVFICKSNVTATAVAITLAKKALLTDWLLTRYRVSSIDLG